MKKCMFSICHSHCGYHTSLHTCIFGLIFLYKGIASVRHGVLFQLDSQLVWARASVAEDMILR